MILNPTTITLKYKGYIALVFLWVFTFYPLLNTYMRLRVHVLQGYF